jgi:hypothetical protein
MMVGAILIATVAAGCYGGGSGYSGDPYGYNSNYSSYGNSYPYSGYNSGYSYAQSYGNSYSSGYQNGVRADENRDRNQERVTVQHTAVVRDHDQARTGTQTRVDHDKYSRRDSDGSDRSVKN